MQVDISALTKTLIENNVFVNNASVAVNSALQIIANILLSLFFLLELGSYNQLANARGGKLPMKMWGELALKYLGTWLLMKYSAQILDGLMWLLNAGPRLVLKNVTLKDYSFTFDIGKVKGIEKIILNTIGHIVEIIANAIVVVIGLMRYMELYFLKAIAPIFLACLMNNEAKPIAMTFLKYFGATVLITLGLTVVAVIYPVLFSQNFLYALTEQTTLASGPAILSILQGSIFIITIVGVSRKMLRLVGV